MILPILRYFLALSVLAGIYFLAGKLGLSLALINATTSAIWPPTGLALAGMLMLGYRIWPAVLAGAFLVNLTTSDSAPLAGAIAVGNTLEAVLGTFLATRFAGGRRTFDRAENIVRYVFFAAVPATVACATIGTTAQAVAGTVDWAWYAPVWMTWWTGDFTSAITITPLILVFAGRPMPRLSPSRALEATLLAVVIALTCGFIFAGGLSQRLEDYPLSYLALPPIVWAAYRFHHHGALLAWLATATIAAWGTLNGFGPFHVEEPNDSLLLLQMFSGVTAVTALVLAAAVAERTQVAERLEEQEQRMRVALESGRMGTWEWDIASGMVRWSPRLEEIHGLSPGTFPGTFEAFLEDVHADDRERVKQVVARTLEHGRDHEIEYRLSLPDGEVKWVEGRGRIIQDAFGRPARLVGICMDVTDRKRAEVERERLLASEREARAESERASAAKDQFLAVLSHELRTPLTPVLLTTGMLGERRDIPDDARDDILSIQRNVEMEARLIDDLLDLTKVTRGKLELDLQPVDVHLMIHRTVEICCPGESARPEMNLSADRTVVSADPARLQQVLWNLLSNAVKFTPEEGIIAIRTRNTQDGAIRVEIADNGPGIEPTLMPRLFQAFEQGEAARAGRTGGLGLGLAISKALVQAHGGTIEAHSGGSGHGSSFVVTLPEATGQAETGSLAKEPPLINSAAEPLRILLVEDHQNTLELLSRILRVRGHTVTTAGTNADALKAANANRFDLVLSDLGLPDGLAYETMRRLHDRFGLAGIALSGYGTDGDVARSRASGFVEHLTKPVDLKTLYDAIDRVAGNGRVATPMTSSTRESARA
jgi:PAS domain S-box-containing protein